MLSNAIRESSLSSLIDFHERMGNVMITEDKTELVDLILDKTLENRVKSAVERGALNE